MKEEEYHSQNNHTIAWTDNQNHCIQYPARLSQERSSDRVMLLILRETIRRRPIMSMCSSQEALKKIGFSSKWSICCRHLWMRMGQLLHSLQRREQVKGMCLSSSTCCWSTMARTMLLTPSHTCRSSSTLNPFITRFGMPSSCQMRTCKSC